MEDDSLERLVIPSAMSVLEQVDEFTLYCFYTGIDNLVPGLAYNAPYRDDQVPSFSIYRSYNLGTEYMWKDHATGESGNIFSLIRKIHKLSTLSETYRLVLSDFGLVDSARKEKIVRHTPPEQNNIKISVAEIPLSEAGREFWLQFDIREDLLNHYKVSQIKWYWSYIGQLYPYWVKDPTFAYRIGEFYQIYSPYAERAYKFRNDYPESYFFGYLQLPRSGEKLIIDKSAKDVIFCKRIGYDAVCGKSETTMIPHNKMLELKDRFSEVYLMLDNDKAGRNQADKYMALYPWLKPRFLEGAKDKTDLCKLTNVEETKRIVESLLIDQA